MVVVGENSVSALAIGAGGSWSRALPDAVNVAVGYGSVWTLSRLPGARSLVVRHDPRSGRVTGRRVATAGAAAIAVGAGAVWVANGCTNGILRVPVGPGPGSCIRVGKGPSDVAVGAGAVWGADAAGSRIVRLDAATGSIAASWAAPGRPATIAAAGSSVVAATRRGDVFRLTSDDLEGGR